MEGKPSWVRGFLAALLLACGWARATDQQLFHAALRSLHAGDWNVAVRWLEKLRGTEEAELRQRAVLLLGQARFQMGDYQGGHADLSRGLEASGALKGDYNFWMAECRYRQAEMAAEEGGAWQALFGEAARAYEEIIRAYPKSSRLIDAMVGGAQAHARLRNWPQVVEILQPADGVFQKFIKSQPNDRLAIAGRLVLAEALHGSQQSEDALSELMSMQADMLTGEQDRLRRHLQVRIEAGAGRLKEALELTRGLEASVREQSGRSELREVLLLQVEILRQARQTVAVLQPLNELLTLKLPTGERQRLLLEAADTARMAGQPQQAVGFLDKWLVLQHSGETRAAALNARGGFCLKLFYVLPEPERRPWLEQARTNFIDALRDAPEGPHAGHAWLGQGWCQWLGSSPVSSRQAFTEASSRLKDSMDREQARFKLAETLLRGGDHTNALLRFREIARTTNATAAFRVPAMYWSVRSALALGDLTKAEAAAQELQGRESSSVRVGEALLLVAQAQADSNRTQAARASLEALRGQLPLGDLEQREPLERARIEVQEKQYDQAAKIYESWLKTAASGHPDRAAVMFDLGWVRALDRNSTAALGIFLKLTETLADSPQAPLAQMWIGDHYFNLGGTNFVRAEAAYQRVRQMKACPDVLKFRSRLLAGRAALARPNFQDARKYFEALAQNEKVCPGPVWSEAVFALGDVTILESSGAAAPALDKYDAAIGLFEKLIQRNATNAIASRAWGRIGDCHLQLATREPARRHEQAFSAYSRALELVGTGSVFYQAKMGQALVRESEARGAGVAEQRNLRGQALGLYLEVFRGARLDKGRHDLFWLKQSGLAAGRLAEELGDRKQVTEIFSELLKRFPSMKPHLRSRLNQLNMPAPKPAPK